MSEQRGSSSKRRVESGWWVARLRRRLTAVVGVGLGALSLAVPWGSARGDDVADEADLHFRLGAESYTRGAYEDALQHFLQSNRLSPNKNVVFNIGRSYDKLGRYAAAHRYYTQALDSEPDADTKKAIEELLAQVNPKVAVLDIVTTPPGATLYIDRRDLGSRGQAPRLLGFDGGTYTVIAELPGYLPASVRVETAQRGSVTPVRLTLQPILGTVQVRGAEGAQVRVDSRAAKPSCTAPCTFSLHPGRYTLYLDRPGFRPSELLVEVVERTTATVTPEMQALSGSLVVSSDEPGASVLVDGRTAGFTPAIIPSSVGEHHVVVELQGFRKVERTVSVRADRETPLVVELTRSQDVTAASRVEQRVEDAPGSVSIVPKEELQAFRYPTIAESLRGVRGFYLTDDRSYVTAGIRGVSALGSYGNRMLVLVDGQSTNDNWIGSSYVGFDGRTDLADVERVEVVRGPGSVLYGTNAFLGVVNLVTKPHAPGAEVGVDTALDGVARARARGDVALGKHAGAWLSVGMARSQGRDFFVPELAADISGQQPGQIDGADGFRAGTVQGRAWWKWLRLAMQLHRHDKRLPTGEYDTLPGDPRTRQLDQRGYVTVEAEPKLGDSVASLTRLHLNHYRFDGGYPRAPADGGLEQDTYRGSWAGLEQRVRVAASDAVAVTVGAEGQLHFQVNQKAKDETGYFLGGSSGVNPGGPYQVGAAYALLDAKASERVLLSGGLRLDAYSTFGSSLNPRVSAIVRPYEAGNTKLTVGKAFRAPSIYELYYSDGGYTQVAAAGLRPESIYSAEIEHTHRFSKTVTGTVSVYGNYITDAVLLRPAPADPTLIQYQNSGEPVVSMGSEVALTREWRQGWMLSGWYSYTYARYLADQAAGTLTSLTPDPERRQVANSPRHGLAAQGSVPIIGRGLRLSSRVTLDPSRWDRNELRTDPAQRHVGGAAIWDLILGGEEPRWGLGWWLGLYNAFDWRYRHPLSGEFRPRTLPQAGRSLLAGASLRF